MQMTLSSHITRRILWAGDIEHGPLSVLLNAVRTEPSRAVRNQKWNNLDTENQFYFFYKTYPTARNSTVERSERNKSHTITCSLLAQ